MKGVLSLDKAVRGETCWLRCCWSDCERKGFELHQVVMHDHARAFPCTHPDAKHPRFVFCTERHRQYFINSHRSNGNLPTGEKGRIW